MPFAFEKDPVTGYQHPAQVHGPFQGESPEPLSDAELLASTEPIYNILPQAAVRGLKRREAWSNLALNESAARSGKLNPGGIWDETNPAGRAALLAKLDQMLGITP